MSEDQKVQAHRAPTSAIALGAGIGMIFGAAFDNAAVGMVLGAALGSVCPAVFEPMRRKDNGVG